MDPSKGKPAANPTTEASIQTIVKKRTKRNTIGPDGKRASNVKDGKSRLPECPPDAIGEMSRLGPCRRKRVIPKRRGAYRVPLKKEDGNLESQLIEYNCEFPNRVVVRLEYLMQSTKVRLNDRAWMAEFYNKLVEEETRAMKKDMREREKMEMNRMKKLIIEGMMKKIPDELAYLHRHPVFRVNQMLRRLDSFDHGLIATAHVGEDDEITPVEPYEYNGNKFFSHLHEHGTLWTPAAQQNFERHKIEGKIYRAKLRLKLRKLQQMTDEKVMRIMNNADNPDVLALVDPEDLDFNDGVSSNGKGTVIDNSIGALVDRLQTRCNMITNRIEEKLRHSKHQEIRENERLDRRRREQEKYYAKVEAESQHTLSSLNFIKEEHEAEKLDIVEQILKHEMQETIGAKVPTIFTVRSRTHDLDEIMKLKNEVESFKFEGPVFDQLLDHFRISKDIPFHHYEQYKSDILTELDEINKPDKLIKTADETVLMYDRQKLMVEDHISAEKERKANEARSKRSKRSKKRLD